MFDNIIKWKNIYFRSMNAKTRLALYGFIAGLSAILLTYSNASVKLASADEGKCNTDASDCSKWGEATRNDAPLGSHASDPHNDGIGKDDPDKHDDRAGLGNLNLDGDGEGGDHPSETSCNLGGPC